jgi:virginiamycin B lyase
MLATALPAAPPPPAPPTILGPRETESLRVTYRFLAARAVGFRCAFDSVRLHRCGSSYSERLAPGTHVLRVRAVARDGRQSRVVKVRVLILMPLPPLAVGSPVSVGPGAGVPAVGNGDVWVPTTNDGMLARVSGGAVVSRTRVGAPGGDGFLDSAVRAGGSVWSASDAGATVSRVAPAATVAVAERPGGLTEGGGAVWAFHFLRGTVTRIEASTAVATTLEIDGARATGLAYGDDTLWLLTTGPARVLRIDPASGRVTRSTPLVPPFALSGSLIDTWWLAYGEGAVSATLPNYRAVARVDVASGAVRYVALRQGQPFGVDVGGGSVWVATDRAVVRLDAATGRALAASSLPTADRSGFVSIVYGDGAAWLTNYDRGTVVRVTEASPRREPAGPAEEPGSTDASQQSTSAWERSRTTL